MSVQVGDQIAGGKIVVASVSDDLVASVTVPSITDSFANPLTITLTPPIPPSQVLAEVTTQLALLGLHI